MEILKEFQIGDTITLQMNSVCRHMVKVSSKDDLLEALEFARKEGVCFHVLGSGSNVYTSEYLDALVILMRNISIDINEHSLTVGAGVILDELIQKTIAAGLGGMENLTRIPGTIGGAIVQNAGAYGMEIKDIIKSVEVYSLESRSFKTLTKDECGFEYRNSVFKSDKYIIYSCVFELPTNWHPNTSYEGVSGDTPKKIRNCIWSIRERKFGDHKNSAGSFFKNPILDDGELNSLLAINPSIPHFPFAGKHKIALAYVMDKVCGLNGYTEGNIFLSKENPLIVKTSESVTEQELTSFVSKIKKIVYEKTKLHLEDEVVKL